MGFSFSDLRGRSSGTYNTVSKIRFKFRLFQPEKGVQKYDSVSAKFFIVFLLFFFLQLKAFYVDLIVPLESNIEKDTKVVQVT